MVSKRM